MQRRDLLKLIPLSAIAPVAALASEKVQDGVERVELKPGHFLIFFDCHRIDVESLIDRPGILPEGSTGGYLVPVMGDVEGAVKIFKLAE